MYLNQRKANDTICAVRIEERENTETAGSDSKDNYGEISTRDCCDSLIYCFFIFNIIEHVFNGGSR